MEQVTRSKLKTLLYIVAGLGGISLVIVVHEMGHFLFAKLFGVATPTFSLGFGPALFSLSIGKTVFQIAALPFGGYVEMDPHALAAQPYIQKILILLAGILFNFIFAYCILLYYTMRNQFIITPIIDTVTPHSPAENADLQPDDRIVACNNIPVENNATNLLKTISSSAGKTILLTIERNGTSHKVSHEISIALGTEHPIFGNHTGWLGIELKRELVQQNSFFNALKTSHAHYTENMQNIGRVIAKMMSTKTDPNASFIGPIGIISMMGKSLAINPQIFWLIVAMISLNIGFFNILPLPFFDGGKALIATIELIIGTAISPKILWYITMIFLTLFMLFVAKITLSDVKRLSRK